MILPQPPELIDEVLYVYRYRGHLITLTPLPGRAPDLYCPKIEGPNAPGDWFRGRVKKGRQAALEHARDAVDGFCDLAAELARASTEKLARAF